MHSGLWFLGNCAEYYQHLPIFLENVNLPIVLRNQIYNVDCFKPNRVPDPCIHCEHGLEIPILTFWHQNVLNCSKNTADKGSEVQFEIGLIFDEKIASKVSDSKSSY